MTNIRHYIDDDESGRFFDRSAYSRMMEDVENGKIGRVYYERHDPLGARLSPSRQRYGDIQTEQCALYRGQQRDRQREARHIGVCALYQHHVGVVRKGHQQESKDRH